MLRAILAAGLLATVAIAFAPSAQAAPLCDAEGLGDRTIDMLVCVPGGHAAGAALWTAGRPSCLLNTPPNQWATCGNGLPSPRPISDSYRGYALCYGTTPPFDYLDCVGQ